MMKKKRTLKTGLCRAAFLVCALILALVFFPARPTPYTVDLTEREMAENAVYQLQFDTGTEGADLIGQVLASSGPIESMTIGGMEVTTYSGDFVSEYLYKCESVVDVSTIDDFLYISYNTTDNKYVNMCYTPSGLRDLCIYENDTDTMIAMTISGNLKYKNFRNGSDC